MPNTLQLNRPIVFFDIESTGTDPVKDRIVELSMLRVAPGMVETSFHVLLNPGMPIPREASAIHGITDEDVLGKPTFAEVAKEIARFIEDSDLGGYNCLRFDIPMLAEEFYRAEVPIDLKSRKVVDVQVIFHKREQRTLTAAYSFYCGKDLPNAHSADADTRATYEVLLGQLERYPDLPGTVAELDEYTHFGRNVDFAGRFVYDDRGRELFNFGKHRGKTVEEVLTMEPSYFDWMMKGDFAKDTLYSLMQIKKRMDLEKSNL